MNEIEGARVVFERTGGFMGVNENLSITADCSAVYLFDLFDDAELVITEEEVKNLLSLTEFFIENSSYEAKTNAADYFMYKLTVQTTSNVKTIEWVDAWASIGMLPSELEEIQNFLLGIIEQLNQQA